MGPDCLEKLNGIFAFAVWQQRAQKLFLARDRIGVKPLFYALRGDSLIFASELKTLLCHPEIPPQVDSHGLADVLLLGPGRTPGVRGVPQCAGIEARAAAQNTLCHRLVRRASPCAATGS